MWGQGTPYVEHGCSAKVPGSGTLLWPAGTCNPGTTAWNLTPSWLLCNLT